MASTVGQGGSEISTDFIHFSTTPNVAMFSFTVGFCLLGMIYVGFDRFIFIPLLFTVSNVIAVVSAFYTWGAEYDGTARSSSASVFFTYLGYYLGETFVVMYGYFFVEKLLPVSAHRGSWLISRKQFMCIFWVLQTGHIAARVAAIVTAVREYQTDAIPNDAPPVIYDYTLAHFVILTTIELFTAYFLIVIFSRSRKMDVRYLGGKRLPLLKHMLLSTELRVVGLSVLYLFRAAAEKPKMHNRPAQLIDNIVSPMINLFPLLLVLDCVLRKSLKIEVDYQARIEKCTCIKENIDVEAARATPAVICAGRSNSDTSEKTKAGDVAPVVEEATSLHSSC